MKKAAKPLAVADAEAKLRKVLADPPYRDAGGSTWERPRWVRFRALVAALPPGISPALVDALIASVYARGGVIDLDDLPGRLDEVIVRHVETRQRHPRMDERADAAFVLTALRVQRRGDRHALLRELLYLAHFMPFAENANRKDAAELAARPEILDGAHAAVAVGDNGETSRYLPILAADATPASLDLLLPIVEAARADGDFDWIQKDLAPLFPDTPHIRAIVAGLTEAKTERAAASPARAFVETLGMRAPASVKITVTFRDADEKVTYQLRIDSARGCGFEGRLDAAWQWGGVEESAIATRVPPATVDYILRASAGLERAKVDAWVRRLLPRDRR